MTETIRRQADAVGAVFFLHEKSKYFGLKRFPLTLQGSEKNRIIPAHVFRRGVREGRAVIYRYLMIKK